MKTYTVLLLRPEHAVDNFGTDTYMTHVEAENVAEAERLAQSEVCAVDGLSEECNDPADYVVLCVIEGKHMDIKTS